MFKKLVYKWECHLPIDIFKVAMYSLFEFGDEKMVKKLEACIDEFKIPANITVELLTLNSLGLNS